MGWFCAVLAVVAGCIMLVASTIGLTVGPFPGWLIVGPFPFYLVGVFAFWRRPDSAPVRWLLVTGSCFVIESSLGSLLPWAVDVLPAPAVTLFALARHWASLAATFGGLGLIGTFPAGRPERASERVILGVAGIEAALLPVLNALSSPTLMPGQFSDPTEPVVASTIFVPALAWLGAATATLYLLYPLWVVAGVGLLALRYRRSATNERLRIRWLLVGWAASLVTWVPLLLLPPPSEGSVAPVLASLLWPATQVLALGSTLIALLQDGVFGIDRPARRRAARTVVRFLIAVPVGLVALAVGLLAGRFGGTALAVLAAVVTMALARPLWLRLERAVDRWVFGARLDGYDLLARFGSSLEAEPTPDRLADELARTLHAGLDLTWVTVTLDPPIEACASAGTSGRGAQSPPDGAPASVEGGDEHIGTTVPIAHAGETLGRIASGPRRDGPLIDEDRRLLGILAAQAGAAASALRLSAELAERLEEIRRQAGELAASRDRVVKGQDTERRRIQRDLHDGIQQEIVALSAKVSLAQQRLQRGDASAAEALSELQRDVQTLLGEVREFAYTIHPPVLADRGLVEAVEGQASRLTVPTTVQADPDLRTIRLPEPIESAAWYALSEAMSNVVKHARATNSHITLHRNEATLMLSVQDNGRGFDPQRPPGLGLTGLADRLDTVGGTISVQSRPGAGTLLSMQIPITAEAPDG